MANKELEQFYRAIDVQDKKPTLKMKLFSQSKKLDYDKFLEELKKLEEIYPTAKIDYEYIADFTKVAKNYVEGKKMENLTSEQIDLIENACHTEIGKKVKSCSMGTGLEFESAEVNERRIGNEVMKNITFPECTITQKKEKKSQSKNAEQKSERSF